MSSSYRASLESYLSQFDIECRSLLDIGGSAYPVDKRVRSFVVDEYKILDNNNEQGRHDKWRQPDFVADIQIDDDRFIEVVNSRYYDFITCLEVAEYWHDPLGALMNIALLLPKGGNLLITFPFIYPQHEPIESDFLRYTPNGALKLLQESGLELIEFTPRVAETDLIEQFYRAERMRPSKQTDHNVIGSIFLARKK